MILSTERGCSSEGIKGRRIPTQSFTDKKGRSEASEKREAARAGPSVRAGDDAGKPLAPENIFMSDAEKAKEALVLRLTQVSNAVFHG